METRRGRGRFEVLGVWIRQGLPACLMCGGRLSSVTPSSPVSLSITVIVSPDAGGVYRAKKFREGLAQKYDVDAGLAMIIKQRYGESVVWWGEKPNRCLR